MSNKKSSEKKKGKLQFEINKTARHLRRLESKNKHLTSENVHLKLERDRLIETCHNHETNIKKFEDSIERVNQDLIDSISMQKIKQKEFECHLSREQEKFRDNFEKMNQENYSLKSELKSNNEKLEKTIWLLMCSEKMLEKKQTEFKLALLENEQFKSKIQETCSNLNVLNDLIIESKIEIDELIRKLAEHEENQNTAEIEILEDRVTDKSDIEAVKQIQNEAIKEQKILLVETTSKLRKSEETIEELKAQIEHINISNAKKRNELQAECEVFKKKLADQVTYSQYLAKILSDRTETILRQRNLATNLLNITRQIKEDDTNDLVDLTD